jgi:RNA polymerase sigma-70 factor (ECF subfamily)
MEQSGVLNTGLEVEEQTPSISVEQFNAAIRDYYQPIFRYLFHRTHNEQLALDLCQETFTRLWERPPNSVIEQGSTNAWLKKVAHNLLNDHRKQAKARPQLVDKDIGVTTIDFADGVNGYERVHTGITFEVLGRLSTESAELVVRKMLGFSWEEIGKSLGVSSGAARSRANVIKQGLRELLEEAA